MKLLRERVVPIKIRELDILGNKRMQIYRSNRSKENTFRFLWAAKDSHVAGGVCRSIYRLGEKHLL